MSSTPASKKGTAAKKRVDEAVDQGADYLSQLSNETKSAASQEWDYKLALAVITVLRVIPGIQTSQDQPAPDLRLAIACFYDRMDGQVIGSKPCLVWFSGLRRDRVTTGCVQFSDEENACGSVSASAETCLRVKC